ncbi:tRNA threonylcarbamoyladenosine biosynthesis protein RimN [Candidatus Endobugula sertula]|uniref:Threonylcarbamoyl-AMP synthase n=1 Tax=Candidatus Endobugula sertula TaxID=62101 RepID=A0A1D2QNM6_9GAMM|nr:tRNA threonylcarbamoyladenosine biosynthesis protein RimN [Candidatus Endobugula sertula]
MFYQKYNPSIAINVSIMRQGGVVAYPTEAVWGFGCDPYNNKAVKKIFALKQRDPGKGLILVAATMKQLSPYLTKINSQQRDQLEKTWPGPVTWLVPNNGSIPSWISGDFSSVALRVSAHPYVHDLCKAFGGPIVSTSANPQGKPAPRYRWQVCRYFNQSVYLDNIATGCVGNRQQPSEIRDLISGEIIR